MSGFLQALNEQRWNDHRHYHRSRINQSLHLVSALSFIWAYLVIFTHPALAAFLGWGVAMVVRQVGHFFFEPKDYDEVNRATYEHKEDVKIGYNTRRKVILMTIWVLSPLLLRLDPTGLGFLRPSTDLASYAHNVAILWIMLGICAVLFRMVQLFFLRDVQTGIVWVAKILTDPFHDLMQYYKAPLYLLRGELIDPMTHVGPDGAPARGARETVHR